MSLSKNVDTKIWPLIVEIMVAHSLDLTAAKEREFNPKFGREERVFQE